VDEVLIEHCGSVLLLTLNRPKSLNAFNAAMLDALNRAAQLAQGPDVRAVVLTGSGRGFCAGADLKGLGQTDVSRPSGLRHSQNALGLELLAIHKPVIAAINGATAGAGLAIMGAADIRVASPLAKFVPAFASIGVVPDVGATYFLLRDLGYARTYEWLATGRTLNAEQALTWGLITEIVQPEDLVPRAMAIARDLAERPTHAIQLTKKLLLRSLHASLADTLEFETEYQALAGASPQRAAARESVLDRIDSSRRGVTTPTHPA
jgi:2-(1,2-epoxy-1,2-dihydrophenyl)acetyl-CoA isomerase